MAASGAAPVSGVRVMGWCGGEEGEGVTEGGAVGSAAVRSGINFVCFEDGVTVWCCGHDWCDSRYDLQVTGTKVSRDNCYYSEILLDCPELFRD